MSIIIIEKVISHSHSVLSGELEVNQSSHVYRENDWLRISHGYWHVKLKEHQDLSVNVIL